MSDKVISARAAIDLIKSGDTLAIHGAGGGNVEPDLLIKALAEKFAETAQPRDLTVVHISGIGDWKESGLNQLTGDGMIRRDIGGHYGMSPEVRPAHPRQQDGGLLLAARRHVAVAARGGGRPARPGHSHRPQERSSIPGWRAES